MNTYTAKHNVKKHTVTLHSENCSCVKYYGSSVWKIKAESAEEGLEIAKEDAPNVETFKIAPCAK